MQYNKSWKILSVVTVLLLGFSELPLVRLKKNRQASLVCCSSVEGIAGPAGSLQQKHGILQQNLNGVHCLVPSSGSQHVSSHQGLISAEQRLCFIVSWLCREPDRLLGL